MSRCGLELVGFLVHQEVCFRNKYTLFCRLVRSCRCSTSPSRDRSVNSLQRNPKMISLLTAN